MTDQQYTYEVVDSFPEHNLVAEKVFRNGVDANTQLIVKNDKVVAHFTNAYKVLPNEEAYKIMLKQAKANDLIPAHDMPQSWRGPMQVPNYMGSMDGAITALFVDKKEHDLGAIGGKPDITHYGVGMGNSINGQSSLKAYGFTFRVICGNYAFHIFHQQAVALTDDLGEQASINDARLLAKKVFLHSKNLNVDAFSEAIQGVIDTGHSIMDKYRLMKTEELLEKQAMEIARTIPKKVTKNVDWLSWDEDNKPSLVGEVDQFTAFNDVTDILTHEEKLSYNTKMESFAKIDRILVNVT